ncbi:MAG: HmuY family protein [Cyclobacteriaceae bacterium]
MYHTSIKFLAILFLAVVTLSSCEDDPKLPDNQLQFESSVAGISSEDESLTLNMTLSRAVSADVVVTLSVNGGALVYGTDFTTTPAAVGNMITLTIPAGETTSAVTLNKVAGVGFSGDETIVFEVVSIDGSPGPGENSKISVTFSEITVTSAAMNIRGGGPTFPNRVFIDLSANRQTAVNRTDWDFGFYTAEGEFKVILNSGLAMLAKPLDKTDLTTVTAADTVGLGASFTTDAFSVDNIGYIDDPSGNLGNLAIDDVSATASENKVYIVNRGKDVAGNQRAWKKVRVIRNGDNYTIQYADIAATTFQTLEITRDNSYVFNYVSLDANSAVQPEPEKRKWDIAYTTFMNQTNLGEGFIPYMFNDFIIQNREGVQTVQLLVSNVGEYADFDAADLTGITFGTAQNTIGSGWRNGGGPSTPPSLRMDRFYLVKDADGNVYKVKFTALTTDGERGRPAIEYALVSAGS